MLTNCIQAKKFYQQTEKTGSVGGGGKGITYAKGPLSVTPVNLTGRAGITEKYIKTDLKGGTGPTPKPEKAEKPEKVEKVKASSGSGSNSPVLKAAPKKADSDNDDDDFGNDSDSDEDSRPRKFILFSFREAY